MGMIFVLVAMLSWGVGDFLIQKSARKFGDLVALFYITAFGSIVLFPFIYSELYSVFIQHTGLILLVVASFVILFSALFDFQALKVGKISVVEPIYAFELPITAGFAAFIIGEHLSLWQTILIIAIMLGIFLVATKSFGQYKHFKWEKGVWYAILATIAMGVVNFMFGVASRDTSPLMINWFSSTFMAIVVLAYLLKTSRAHEIIDDWKNSKKLILAVSFMDNLAWVAFSYAMLYIPIAVATGVSESYIALAAGLGIILNKEKLKKHQWVGLVVCLVAAIALAFITGK